MSFYGSVYYQLIDTFYKAVLRNKGKNKITFVDTDQIPDSVETPAVGRKGVFGFDTGNRWINLNVVSEEKPESNELYSIYEIYHGAPDTTTAKPYNGFKLLGQSIDERMDDQGVIQLEYFDEFETYEGKYDNAGHIAGSERRVYRLPKAEVNDRVSELERLVGTDADRQLPEMENEEDQNLYGYVEENTKDIQTLESYTGDWSKVVSNWISGTKWAPTIADTIGNLEDMYNSAFDRYNNHKTFAEIIGKLPTLYEKINEGNPISLIAAILKENTRLDGIAADLKTHKEASELSFSGIKALIGSPIDGEGSDVYEHIAADRAKIGTPIDDTNDIYDHITILYDDLNWPVQQIGQQKITVSGEINRLDNKIGVLDESGTATVASEIARLDNKVGSVPEGSSSLRAYIDTNLEDIDEIFTYDLGTNYTNDENGSPTHTAFELIKENANNISSINTFIGMVEGEESPDENSLITKITNLQNFVGGEALDQDEDSLNTHINNIKNYVGYTTPQEGEEVISLTNQINSIGELIGGTTLGEDDEGKKENNLITRINNLESATSIIGTSTDTQDTLYGAINSANTSITNLVELIGNEKLDEGSSNLITQLSNINQTLYIDDQNTGKECLITQVNNLQNLIGIPDGSTTGSVFTQINNIKNDIGDVANDLKSHDFGENVTINSITDVLNNILTRLETLEEEVKNLKDVSDSGNTETPPEDEQEPSV